MEFNEGQEIYKYLLLKKLGKGSFGEVWLAYDKTTDRNVALKILPSQFSEVAIKLEESRNGNRVSHKNLLQIYCADVVEILGVALVLIAQEFQKGGTIVNHLNAHKFLPLPDLLKYLKEVLMGLEYLHNANVIHNDIKPGNILIADDGRAILSDYGISTVSEQCKPTSAPNAYRIHEAPETLLTNSISASADIYQLGCTAYRLANGIDSLKCDWDKDHNKFLEDKKNGKIFASGTMPYVPKKLFQIIKKATDVNLGKRYASAIEMKHALEKLCFPGYWTTNPNNTSELIGYGKKYSYTYEVVSKANNLFDFNACQTKNDNGRTTKIAAYCKRNLSSKDKDKLLKDFFEFVINNAK